jgi:ribonuclease J
MNKIKIFSLGGLNESGKNMYVVEVNNDIFVFDSGLKYADDQTLGVDYIIPNYNYLIENEKRIKGIFITHGQDEQMGAIPDMIVDLKNVKVYGTKFTLDVLKEELVREKLPTNNLVLIEPHRQIKFGENSIFPITLSHSVPDNVGYVLNTKDGAIFYTGNFLFDTTMLGSYKTDIGKLAYVGKQGVLCLMAESLYASKVGYTSPKHRQKTFIKDAIDKCEGRIICNVFSNQMYRIEEILTAVSNTNRKVILMGKRLEETVNYAIDNGYLKFNKKLIGDLKNLKDDNAFILVSDEREKAFSSLHRIVKGFDKFIKLNSNDNVLFVSPVYPSNEKTATRLFDKIARIGANLITIPSKDYLDLHASSEDLMMMINLMNPKYYMPVIGEYKEQVANKNAALQAGMKEENILLRLNGVVTTFIDGKLVDTDEVIKTDDVLIDGKTPGDIGELVIKDREALSDNGIVIVTATIDKKTKKVLAGPEILTRGFVYVKESSEILSEAAKISNEVILENIKNNYVEFNKIKTSIRDRLGKYLFKETECRPMILVVIQEV